MTPEQSAAIVSLQKRHAVVQGWLIQNKLQVQLKSQLEIWKTKLDEKKSGLCILTYFPIMTH